MRTAGLATDCMPSGSGGRCAAGGGEGAGVDVPGLSTPYPAQDQARTGFVPRQERQ